jgi:hypothetical protein
MNRARRAPGGALKIRMSLAAPYASELRRASSVDFIAFSFLDAGIVG